MGWVKDKKEKIAKAEEAATHEDGDNTEDNHGVGPTPASERSRAVKCGQVRLRAKGVQSRSRAVQSAMLPRMLFLLLQLLLTLPSFSSPLSAPRPRPSPPPKLSPQSIETLRICNLSHYW